MGQSLAGTAVWLNMGAVWLNMGSWCCVSGQRAHAFSSRQVEQKVAGAQESAGIKCL